MKSVLSQQDALEKAYDAGLIVAKGTLKIESIGNRKTNRGKGMTLTIKDATLSQAKESVKWFINITNQDISNQRNGTSLTLRLTTFNEGEAFTQRQVG